MEWLDTLEDWNWMLENWERVLDAAQVNNGSCCYFAFLSVHFLDFGQRMKQRREGCLCIPGGGPKY